MFDKVGEMDRGRHPFSWVLGILGCLLLLSACVTVGTTTRVTGAATIEDLQAEDHYKSAYADRMGAVAIAVKAFEPSGSNPGVCNKGGTKQGCFDADTRMIEALRTLTKTLATTPVPPRYAAADRSLRASIQQWIDALVLRNEAIAESDDAKWHQHQESLQSALSAFQAAYDSFPEDNRPFPGP